MMNCLINISNKMEQRFLGTALSQKAYSLQDLPTQHHPTSFSEGCYRNVYIHTPRTILALKNAICQEIEAITDNTLVKVFKNCRGMYKCASIWKKNIFNTDCDEVLFYINQGMYILNLNSIFQ